ncbi:MAG: hypothetical protein MI743_03125 [Sneathiellales bacterium]|nr:hypothetical protein [Sneathiellales bacterium]
MQTHNTLPSINGDGARPLNSPPILIPLLKLSLPNMLVMLATAIATMAETTFVGMVGPSALAGIAAVFPLVMLQQAFSNGAMGGGVSSAVSRALGARDVQRAEALTLHAFLIGITGGLLTSLLMLLGGEFFYSLLGIKDEELMQALFYSNVIFTGSISIWLTSMLVSVFRGYGNMKLPSQVLMCVLILQSLLAGILGFGWGSIEGMGMAGIALGQILAYSFSALYLLWLLLRGTSGPKLRFTGISLQTDLFWEILKVGLITCISPLQTILTVLITTAYIGKFGRDALAGYGIGARLEMILIPIAFGIGVACVPMVGMAIGAKNVKRARKVAAYGSVVSMALLSLIGLWVVLLPHSWSGLFTDNLAIKAVANDYLVWSGPAYGFFGLGLCLLFASQGAKKVMGPVLAGTVRLLVVIAGCWFLSSMDAPAHHFFILVAIGMLVYGLFAGIAVYRSNWSAALQGI